MKCPKCYETHEFSQTVVLETRQFQLETDDAFYWNYRRRKCNICGHRFSTHETIAPEDRHIPLRLKKKG